MKKITDFVQFKKAKGFDEFNKEIVAALAKISAKYEIVFAIPRTGFTNGYAEMKLVASVIGANGEIATKEAEEFKQCAHLFDLSPEDLGKAFFFRGQNYVITGMRSGRKNPVMVKQSANGKSYLFSATLIKQSISRV